MRESFTKEVYIQSYQPKFHYNYNLKIVVRNFYTPGIFPLSGSISSLFIKQMSYPYQKLNPKNYRYYIKNFVDEVSNGDTVSLFSQVENTEKFTEILRKNA